MPLTPFPRPRTERELSALGTPFRVYNEVPTPCEQFSCFNFVHRIMSEFSIWRVDNVIASFCAHSSVEQPTRTEALDLHHVLLRNPNCYIVKDLNADSSIQNDQSSDQLTHHKSMSGWDVLRTMSRPSNYCMSTPHFERIWWDKGNDTKKPFSIWRPLPLFGFASVGDCISEG